MKTKQLQPTEAKGLATIPALAVPSPALEPDELDEELLEYVEGFASHPGASGFEAAAEGSGLLLRAMQPRDATELMLCSQIVETYHSSLRFLALAEPDEQESRDLKPGAHPDHRKVWEAKDRSRQGWARIAVSMINASARAAETLGKRNGQATSHFYRVEHIAQAVIGALPGGGENDK